MVCSIGENKPLMKLARDLDIAHQCHSPRPRCVQGFEQKQGDKAFGIPGAAIGYCQALFNYEGTPKEHTKKVMNLLSEIDAPWAESHELFWGYKNSEDTNTFLNEAITPLTGTGRVPILITGLDPANDLSEIENIIDSSPPIHSGETILLRIILNNDSSIKNVSKLIKRILSDCRSEKQLPKWFPLLQGNFGYDQWLQLKSLLNDDWEYVNIAINPFVSEAEFEFIKLQITVAQIPIGLEDGISENGLIKLAKGMKIMGADQESSYSLTKYITRLNTLNVAPTLIVLGPSLAEWSDKINQKRIQKLLPILRENCNILWDGLSMSRRKVIWEMAA